MPNDIAIKVTDLQKSFKLPHEKNNSIKGALVGFTKGKRTFEKQTVLSNISFEIKKGEFFGIVGRNGSGKSTLLKLLAGIYSPDKGAIKMNGRLTPFIELGVGFNPELSGRENVYLNGALLGFNRSEMAAMYEDIVEFAELSRFMDQKLKNYSSGMQVRLAFSIAIRAQSEILLIDEVLAVGDTNFQKKCFDTFREIKKRGTTVVLVTHDMNAVQNFCDSALLLHSGKILSIGSTSKVTKRYNDENLESSISQPAKSAEKEKTATKKYRPAHIINTTLIDSKTNKKKITPFKPDQEIVVEVTCKFSEDIESPIIGITLKDNNDQRLFDSNTRVAKIGLGLCRAGELRKVRFTVQNILSDGIYKVHAAIASRDATVFYDIDDEAAQFRTAGWDYPSALIQPKHEVKLMTSKG